jgi:hypothetical protein
MYEAMKHYLQYFTRIYTNTSCMQDWHTQITPTDPTNIMLTLPKWYILEYIIKARNLCHSVCVGRAVCVSES